MIDSQPVTPARDALCIAPRVAARGVAGLLLPSLLMAAFVIGHAPYIATTLDGIDSANFTLAVDRYDPGLHQPHPPGFPLHVAIGRLVTQAYQTLGAASGDAGTAAAGLRIWSVISGALAVLSLMWIAAMLGASASRGVLVAALAATCPLFWITAMRPLSDVPGLCFSLLSQALALSAYDRRLRESAAAAAFERSAVRAVVNDRLLKAGVVAGLAVGIRVQTAVLTLPLLLFVTLIEARRGRRSVVVRMPIAIACGMLAWAVPMILAVGGTSEYVRLLTTVAVDDIQGVDMIATNPSARLLAMALFRTFIIPWNSPVLGWCAFGLAAVGAWTLARGNRRALGIVTLMGLPYLVFHLLFQESASIRYALPLVPTCCLLVVAGLESRPRAMMAPLAAVLLIFSSTFSISAASGYGETRSPVARAIGDILRAARAHERWPALAFHHSVGRAIRGEVWPGAVLQGQVGYESLEVARYWLEGGRERIWFLSDDRRTDLALIDPAARTRLRSYRWPGNVESLLGGAQPLAVTWHEIASPGWFLMRGWSVTAETNGVSRRDGHSPAATGITGYVRRRATPAVMMIGGRNIGTPFETGATVELAIDGRPRAAWVASPQSSFLQVIALPAGELLGAGAYAPVVIRAWDVAGTARLVDIAVEHFDVQSPGAAAIGIGRGWHSPELNHDTGRSWRWTDERAELRVDGFGRDVELVIRGESPLRYFQTGPRVVVRAGSEELASFQPDADFEWVVPVPAPVLAASEGRVVIESNRWFIPDEKSGNGDRRRLALRIYGVEARLKP
jgi:hypothetical protein